MKLSKLVLLTNLLMLAVLVVLGAMLLSAQKSQKLTNDSGNCRELYLYDGRGNAVATAKYPGMCCVK